MAKPRFQEKYEKEVMKALAQEFGIKNKMAIPKIEKIVVNVGVGEIAKNKDTMEGARNDIAQITGQRPSVRGEKMYAFLDRLISIVLPRFRDFRGVSAKSFDKSGNYTLGIYEHPVFPDLDLTKAHAIKGFEITIVANAGSPKRAKRMLELMGMPFEKV